MSLYSGSGLLSGMQISLLYFDGFLVYNVSIYSGNGVSLVGNVSLDSGCAFLSSMQCVTLQWKWVSLCYALCHSSVTVSFSLVCNVSHYSGSTFLSVTQCVTLQWQWGFSVIQCQYTMFLFYTISLLCKVSSYSGCGFLSGMQYVTLQWS